MTQPVITLSETDVENIPTVVQLFRQYDIDHLPIIDSQGQVISVITLREVMERLCQTIDAKTAELAQEVAQRQHITELLSQKEASYQASQARINDILDNAIATSITNFRLFSNRDWQYEYQSPGCETIFGYISQEILSDKNLWMSQVHPEDKENVIMPLIEDLLAERTVTVEYRFQHKDGSLRWISGTYTSHYDAANNCWSVTGTANDITERKGIETALAESEDQYRLLFENNPNPLCIFELETFRFLAVNRAAIEKYGYSEAEFLSITVKDIRPPEGVTEFLHIMSEPSIFVDSIFIGETKHRLKDGTVIDVEINSHFITWAGKPARFALMKDITEQKQAELALQEREGMLRRIGDNLPNGAIYKAIRELDGSDRYSYLSAGFNTLMEVDPEDALRDASLLYRQFMPEDMPRLQAALAESMANLSVFDIQLPIRTPSGQLKWLHFRSTPRQLEDGCFAWDGLVVDVTNIKQTEETLRRSEGFLAESQRLARLGSWDFDIATGKITWSKELFRLFNYDPTREEPNYDDHLLLYYPEEQEKLDQAIARTIATGESYKLILRTVQPDNSYRYIEAIGHAEYNVDGQVIRLYGTAQDVSDRIESEEKLKQAELRYRTLIEQIPGVVYTSPITATSEFSYISPQIQKMLKIPPEQWNAGLFNSWLEYVHPDDRDRVVNSVQNAIATGESVNLEYRLFTADGEMIWVQDQASLVLAPDGKTPILQGVAFDISDRKIAEQTLQEQENFLRSIYHGVGQSIFVVDVLDDDFRFVSVNPVHEHITGFCSDNVQGKTPQDFLSANAAAVVRQHYQDCIDAGATITYEECLPFKGKEESWWITTLTPLKDENLRIYRIVGSSVNITEHKSAQKMLELQAVITRTMAEGICLIRASDGIIVYTNPKFEQMFGYETGELIGQNISIINYEDDKTNAQQVKQAIIASVLEHGETTYEVHNVKKDGNTFWCSGTASVFEHPEYGTVFVAVQQDITEHKKAEAKIKASLAEKEVLLKEIHHRVKNNLGIVSSLLQMQCRRTEDPQATAILRDSQNRIASIALVHEKLYRSEDLANIDFAQYIPDLTTHLFDSYNVSSGSVQLNIQVDDVSLDIETAIPCGLIINELVSNALKYAFPDNRQGEIQLRLYQECEFSLDKQHQDTLILIIRDNGIGLPTDFNSNQTKTLGITLVYGLVKQLRGSIEIKSQQGTEFKITFTKSKT
jgi:PAS domain S-box-containing protein